LQPQLLELGAIDLLPNLILLEGRGIRAFRYWSEFISAKGGPGAPERQGRVTMYRGLLLIGIFVLSPIAKITSVFKLALNKKQLQEDVEYYKGVHLR